MKMIDMASWDRKELFDYFCQMDYPQFNVCTPVDIMAFLQYVRDRGLPFYYATIFAVTAAANKVQNLRYRIREGGVALYDRVHPSFTALSKDTGLFKYVVADMCPSMDEFIRNAGEKERAQKSLFGDGTDEARDDLLYLTCLPWVSFTHVSHTIKLDKDDSIPRISWGKYYTEGSRTLLPLSVQVNHALADGYHVGQFFEELHAFMENLRTADS